MARHTRQRAIRANAPWRAIHTYLRAMARHVRAMARQVRAMARQLRAMARQLRAKARQVRAMARQLARFQKPTTMLYEMPFTNIIYSVFPKCKYYIGRFVL